MEYCKKCVGDLMVQWNTLFLSIYLGSNPTQIEMRSFYFISQMFLQCAQFLSTFLLDADP